MRRIKAIIYVLMGIGVMTLSTCTFNTYDPDVCFQTNVLPIFVSNCATTGCHNASDHRHGFDLTNYEGIMKGITPYHPLRSEIYNAVRGNNPSMPPANSHQLSSKEVSYIKSWISAGAQNSANCISCDTTNYTYSSKIKPLMDSWCLGCHSGGSAGGGYDFSSYSGVAKAITDKKLVGSVEQLSGFIAMPQNAGKLTDCNIKAIEKWVAAGYPEN
jgi:mono/diheme cytochrome c family protein